MPGVIFEDSVTDAGSAIMGGTRVYYVAWEVVVAGPNVRVPNGWDVDTRIGIGHYSLGNDLTAGGLISGVGFGDQKWLDWLIGQHVVSPGADGSSFTSDIAQYIHWSLSPGTEVHFVVFGDS